MSDSGESLSPTISSRFSTFAEAKASIEECLQRYQALDGDDDTVKLLRVTFKYLPRDGQNQFADDVVGCGDDAALRQLADSIDTGLLRPMLSQGGRTPGITPSPRLGLEDSIENLDSQHIDSATRNDQPRLRDNCLKRDGHRCVLSQCWDENYQDREAGGYGPVEAAHIIPFALGKFHTDDERRQISRVWVNIFRYFPSLRARLNLPLGHVNRVDNMMTLIPPLHSQFGQFRFVLEETETPSQYRVKKFSTFASYYASMLPQTVSFTNHDPQHDLPNRELVAVHAAIGNILHASGRAEVIEKLVKDLGECGGMLARDGSTNVGDLLSVSMLSRLSSASNSIKAEDESTKVKPRRALPPLPGTENQR
jgi:hypothetical protein